MAWQKAKELQNKNKNRKHDPYVKAFREVSQLSSVKHSIVLTSVRPRVGSVCRYACKAIKD